MTITSRKVIRAMLMTTLIHIVGCDSTVELTSENETVSQYINRRVCTKNDLLLYQWGKGSVDNFALNEYGLSLPPYAPREEVIRNYYSGALIQRYDGDVENISVVPAGSVFKIKKIFYYSKPFCCQGYRIMATMNGEKHDGKLVEISRIFKWVPSYTIGKPNSIGQMRLNEEHAELCSDFNHQATNDEKADNEIRGERFLESFISG